MGFSLDDIGGFLSGASLIDGLSGGPESRAAEEAAQRQAEAGRGAISETRRGIESAQGRMAGFQPLIDRSGSEASFLANPQAQFDFLQSSPLFQMQLDEAQRQTKGMAASQGRLSAGDTLQDLSNNVLLSSQPLIDRQRQDVGNILNLGTGLARSQSNIDIGEATSVGNLVTDIGAAEAAGQIGASNARSQGKSNAMGLITSAISLYAMSDSRLKEDIKVTGKRNGHDWHSWRWTKRAGELFGLHGKQEGVVAQKIAITNPDCVTEVRGGFLAVNMGKLGLNHGY